MVVFQGAKGAPAQKGLSGPRLLGRGCEKASQQSWQAPKEKEACRTEDEGHSRRRSS